MNATPYAPRNALDTGIEMRFSAQLGNFRLDTELRLPGSGISALLGPSGCGKTTLLRCIAGLHRADHGFLRVGDETWQDAHRCMPTHQRSVGYVFQEASLFPHLSVMGNLRYGLDRSRKPMSQPDFDGVIALMGLSDLLKRDPGKLSGGERQRVAIARALLSGPSLLLMDEPLSGLDTRSKRDIVPYLERLHEQLAIPMIIITHQLDEVEQLADHLALMQAGRVTHSGPLLELLGDPNLPLAQAEGAASVLETQVLDYDEGDSISRLQADGFELLIPGYIDQPGRQRRVRIAASDISLALQTAAQSTILNILPATIAALQPLDDGRVNVRLRLNPDSDTTLLARISQRSLRALALQVEQTVYAQIKGVSLVERRGRAPQD